MNIVGTKQQPVSTNQCLMIATLARGGDSGESLSRWKSCFGSASMYVQFLMFTDAMLQMKSN